MSDKKTGAVGKANSVVTTEVIPDMSDALKVVMDKQEQGGSGSEGAELVKPLPAGAKKFTLPSGRECIVYQGKGRHAIEAHRIIDGDSSLYLPALMSILTTIDGQDLVLEDITEMALPDYHMIQGNFSESNFTSPQGT